MNPSERRDYRFRLNVNNLAGGLVATGWAWWFAGHGWWVSAAFAGLIGVALMSTEG